MHMVRCSPIHTHSYLVSNIDVGTENNRYDKTIKDALAKNGADVTDGGSVPGGSGTGGSGGGTSPHTNSTGGGADGGSHIGSAECVQSQFSVLASREVAFSG